MKNFVDSTVKTALTRRSCIKQVVVGAVAAVGLVCMGLSPAIAQDKTIVWGKKLEATLLDPATSILASSWELLHVIYDGLTDTDENMNAIPGLAESWTQPNQTTYVFKLRQGVKFSNGREMTADDVIGSLQRMMDPKTGSFFRLQLGNVKSMSSSDASTVTIELEEPYAPLLTALSSTMASILAMKELNEGSIDLRKDTLGTGPFMVESHASGDEWVLVRNPHYYKAGLPKADKLIVRIMPSDQALIAGLRAGEVHVAQFDASPDAKLLLQTLDNVEIVQNQQSNLYWLVVNAVAEGSPFRNQSVRQAVALAIDRNQLVNVALGGSAAPTTAFAPMFNACDASKLPLFARDVERAKALLKEAGVEGLTLDIPNVPGAVNDAMYAVLQKNLAEVGITLNIKNMDEGTWVNHVWVDNPMSVDLTGLWYAGYSDAIMVPLWFIPKKAGFTSGYQMEDAELIAAVENLRGLPKDDPNRAEAMQNVCAMIHNQANHIPLITRQETMAYRSDLIDASAIRHTDGYADNLRDVEVYTLH